jgi:carbamoyl-phosphate synthase small subunit
MPCTSTASELLEGFNGVVIGSGPGNPALLKSASSAAGEAALSGKPALGVCLGMQLMALGVGGETFKLKFGHRGVNKPVVDLETGRGYISTHNHGYAVNPASLEGTGFKPWLVSPDDGVLEGMRHEDLPALAVQFHPEGGPGPWDTSWVFDVFASLVRRSL